MLVCVGGWMHSLCTCINTPHTCRVLQHLPERGAFKRGIIPGASLQSVWFSPGCRFFLLTLSLFLSLSVSLSLSLSLFTFPHSVLAAFYVFPGAHFLTIYLSGASLACRLSTLPAPRKCLKFGRRRLILFPRPWRTCKSVQRSPCLLCTRNRTCHEKEQISACELYSGSRGSAEARHGGSGVYEGPEANAVGLRLSQTSGQSGRYSLSPPPPTPPLPHTPILTPPPPGGPLRVGPQYCMAFRACMHR